MFLVFFVDIDNIYNSTQITIRLYLPLSSYQGSQLHALIVDGVEAPTVTN